MSAPFSRPTARPVPSAATTETPAPPGSARAITDAASAIDEPTDRSIPRVPIARLCPSVMRMIGAAWNSRLRITIGLRNPGVKIRSTITSRAKAM